MPALRRIAVVVLIGTLITACDPGDVNVSGMETRPDPDPPATGPVVAELTIDDTTFRLHDEDAGCVTVEIDHPRLQQTTHNRCFADEQVLAATSACGWFEDTPEEVVECDVQLPRVFYGRVTSPQIGHVCVGHTVDDLGDNGGPLRLESARFLSIDHGFILEPALDDFTAGFLFTSEGLIWGQPPLDAPAAPIYQGCIDLAPWGDTPGAEYWVDLTIDFMNGDADTYLVLDAGLGPMGIPTTEDGRWDLSVPSASTGLEIAVERPLGEATARVEVPWPESFQRLLEAGEPCAQPNGLRLIVGPGALEGSVDAFEMQVMSFGCQPPTDGGNG